jgi:hypothetical protein
MPLTPEERLRWQAYTRKAHQKAKENPKPCTTEGCEKAAAPRRRFCHTCRSRKYRESHDRKSYQADHRARTKAEAIEAYGGACGCCGETEPVFMSLDHVQGGGKQHRKEIFGQKGGNMWAWAKNNGYPDSLRLLCFNCNFAEHWGGCPHQLRH